VIATDFQLEAVLGEGLGGGGLDAGDVVATLLVHLPPWSFPSDGAHRGNELAGEQRMQPFGFERSPTESRRGDRDRFARRLHPDVKIGFDVDAHAIRVMTASCFDRVTASTAHSC